MKISQRFSIKQQFMFGFSLMVVLLVVIVLSTITQLNKTSEVADQITELRVPTAFTTATMRKGIVHALAALRGWMILKEDKFKAEREEAWRNEIEPSLKDLQNLSINWTNPENIVRLTEVEELLSKLKLYQQDIESISHTPANKPGSQILIEELIPQVSVMTEYLLDIIALEEEGAVNTKSKTFLLLLAQMNSTLGYAEVDLVEFTRTANTEFKRSFQLHWDKNQLAFDEFSQHVSSLNQQQKKIFSLFSATRERFAQLAPKVIEIRQQADWNLANYWLATKAAPLGVRLETLLAAMQSNQRDLLITDNTSIHQSLTGQVRFSWLLLFIGVLASILFGFILQFMLRLLAELNNSATTLSKGEDINANANANANANVNPNLERTDEFGEIARSLSSLNEYLVETGEHAKQVSTGRYDIEVVVRSEADVLGNAMELMRENLLALDSSNKEATWLQKGRALIADGLSTEQNVQLMASNILSDLCQYVNAQIGMMYQWHEQDNGQGIFQQVASYAYSENESVKDQYRLGEGLIGQAAEEDKILTLNELPEDYIQIHSSLGQTTPKNLVLIPFAFRGKSLGVIELGFIDEIEISRLELFESIREPLAIAFESLASRARIEQGLVEAKALADEISRNEARTRTIIDSSVSGIITITPGGIIQSFNASAESLFDYAADEVIGQNVKMLMPASRAKEHDGYLRNFIQTGIAKIIGSGREVVALRKDGSEFHIHLSIAEMKLEDERQFLGMVTDITEEVLSRQELEKTKQQVEQALLESKELAAEVSRNEARTRTIIESSIAGIITISKKGLIESFNVAAEGLFGYSSDEVLGENVKMLMPSGRASEHDGYLLSYLQTGDAKVIGSGREVVGLRKDSSEFHMHLSVAEMEIEGTLFFLGTVTDITEQVKARQRIVEANEELQANSEELQSQQEELRVTNEELTSKSESLEITRQQTELKAQELEEASRYKSEFLANMSHELRTPLNSLLILSGSLAENDEGNLSDEEVESAAVIQDSGKHLLNLINEILDLSKVEAGKMTVENQSINVAVLSTALTSRFNHMAEAKKIGFEINVSEDTSASFVSDETKLNQILSNLISNAIKFTSKGDVKLNINVEKSSAILEGQNTVLAFSVVDSGVGIAKEQHATVFEAFQQADGSTSRQFGGTGLGLSIAQSFAELLGGKIELESKLGEGSSFTLYIPEYPKAKESETITESVLSKTVPFDAKSSPPPFDDNRDDLDQSKPLFLIIEDDVKFAKILFDTCHQQQAQAIVASDGETGINLARSYNPTGIILDYMLPGLDGKAVMSILKEDKTTQHIPVHIISAVDDLMDMDSFGVIGQLIKPVTKKDIKTVLEQLKLANGLSSIDLLLIEDDEANVLALRKLLDKKQVSLSCVGSGKEAITVLKKQHFSAVIMDLGLPDMSGFELLEILAKDDDIIVPPVIVHTGKELSDAEHKQLQEVTEAIVIKSVSSPDRLQDEVHLFINALNNSKESKTTELVDIDESALAGKVVLLVDDDMRNTFALAKVLRKKDLIVHIAPSGKEALSLLDNHNEIDIVLMDIMMPEMDGYQAMGHIREQAQYVDLPIIALTAKAMTGDKEKCLEAGASDYLTKPVDLQKLLVMMQIWL